MFGYYFVGILCDTIRRELASKGRQFIDKVDL